jgi:molybdenum cofactor cytidylyltransferase
LRRQIKFIESPSEGAKFPEIVTTELLPPSGVGLYETLVGRDLFRKRKMSRISAVLLGAGESRRMGVDKLSLPWGRKSMLGHCFETLLRSEVHELIVVLSPRNKGVRNQFLGRKVRTVINPLSKMGMSSSIRRGLQKIHPHCHGILIALGDQPLLKTRTINALVRTFDQGKGGIIVPSFRGVRGNPVIFDRKFKKELLNLRGDVGGRSIIECHPEDVRVVPVESIGVIKDVDTWPAYKPPILADPELRRRKGKC